jgi:hypothetical protein
VENPTKIPRLNGIGVQLPGRDEGVRSLSACLVGGVRQGRLALEVTLTSTDQTLPSLLFPSPLSTNLIRIPNLPSQIRPGEVYLTLVTQQTTCLDLSTNRFKLQRTETSQQSVHTRQPCIHSPKSDFPTALHYITLLRALGELPRSSSAHQTFDVTLFDRLYNGAVGKHAESWHQYLRDKACTTPHNDWSRWI